MATKRLLTTALLLAVAATLAAQPEWNNLEVYRINKLPPHDRVVPEGDWVRCLNGTWRFAYFESPAQATLHPARWDSIRVPGNIERQGFGVPVYVNMKNEFPSDPPRVPTDYNPVGVYERDFELPGHWQGRRVVAKFGAVKSAMYLYINGREVGYSQDSKTPAEWDITRYLRQGSNRMTVKVVRWCDGSYLECQDMWRMSGITRDVVLYAVPTTYISDLKVVADLDTADFSTGLLDVLVDLNGKVQGGAVEMSLALGTAPGDTLVERKRLEPGDWFVGFTREVGPVRPWNDSTPVLYTLTLRLFDGAGRETERLTKRIGFRHLDIRQGQLRLNGQPMEIRGVNRHEHSPVGGHYITPDEMREDIRLMKELGINAVRTSHYPNDELWYDLCDSAGLYLWDEANVESHAQGYGEHSLAKKAEWLDPMLDRIQNMYRRDRNHPSVIAWSLGNECGNGLCMEEAYRLLKRKDPTRLVVYERAELDANTDIVSIMYPSVQFLSDYARNPRHTRPYIIAEYCHAMGNSMGGLKDYWDTIDKYPQLQGGFIWDWADQAFWVGSGEQVEDSSSAFSTLCSPFPASRCWAAGGDFGQLFGIEDDDNFCANGILAADRAPHPCAAEVEAVYTRGRSNAVVPAPARTRQACPLRYDLRHTRSRQAVGVGNSEFALAVSLADGSLTSFTYHGRELLATPLRWHFWRPPTDNDLADPRGARSWQGLDQLQAELLSATPRDAEGRFELHLLFRLTTPDGATLHLRQLVEANPAGQVQLSYRLVPGGAVGSLPMLGVQFGLDTATYRACTFYGNIHESYPDRRSAQRVSTWYKGLPELSEPQYVVPQEQGRHEARWVRFGSGEGALTVASPAGQPPLGFSVRRWADSTLTAARRWWQVGPAEAAYTVTVDHRAAALGTATCGPGVADRYVIGGDSSYTYRFLLDPTGEAAANDPFDLHPDLQRPLATADSTLLRVASIEASRPPAPPYDGGFPALLADGRRAAAGDWPHGWVGFSGADTLDLLLTLEQYADLGEVGLGCSHSPADWVLKPLDVQAQWSIDGQRWSEWHSLALKGSAPDPHGGSRRVVYSLAPRRARSVHFVRLRILGLPRLPVWHPYADNPAWLMLDEVVVRKRK